MLRLPPEPDLPLRDRLARVTAEVPPAQVQAWGHGLARGEIAPTSPDFPPIEWIGGTSAWLPYWSKVWGLRLLLHVGPARRGDQELADLVTLSCTDEAWRVREMALKIAVRHQLSVEDDLVVALLDDPVERVRLQASRALGLRAP